MDHPDAPPTLSVTGKKNSGETMLAAAPGAKFKRRGYGAASVKRGYRRMEVDEPGRDRWRHFHEGEVEAEQLPLSGPNPAGSHVARVADLVDRTLLPRT